MTNQPIIEKKPLVSPAQPKGLLYHYTDQRGLIGILESKTIWATHARYLNDTTEGKIVVEVVRKALQETLGGSPVKDKSMKKLQVNLKEIIANLHMFVTSFSENGDRLSQWRAYSGRNGGYSIGFRAPYLQDVGATFLEKNIGWLRPDPKPLKRCQYRDENAKHSAAFASQQGKSGSTNPSVSEDCNPVNESKVASDAQTKQFATDLLSLVLELAASLKHKGFEEEEEWRIALFLKEKTTSVALKFRPGNSMPVPYLEIDLPPKPWQRGVEEVIVGPCPNPKEAVQSVESLLKSNHFAGVRVTPSGIPYRNW